MTFAEKFLKLRKQALLSQEEAAEKIGVSRQAISRWEQGTALPDAFNLSIICKVFGVSADYLINDDVTENAAENVSVAFNSDDDGASFVMVEKLDSVQVPESSAGNLHGCAKEADGSSGGAEPDAKCRRLYIYQIVALIVGIISVLMFFTGLTVAFYVLLACGIAVSVVGMVRFEMVFSGTDHNVRKVYQKKYYRTTVWMFALAPAFGLVIFVLWIAVMCIISINDLPYDTVINFSFELVFLIWFAIYLIAGLLTTFFLRQPVAKND